LSEPVQVRAVQRGDFPDWKQLWDGYNAFYGRAGDTALAPDITLTTWARFFDAYEPVHALVAEVAGGIVVCLVGWQLLNSPNTQPAVDRSAAPAPSPEDLSQQAFYPMTMPLTVGPGSISVALTLGANPPPGFRPLLVTVFAHAVGILLVALGVYLCYRYAEVILRKLGPTGTGVVVRLTAFILLCIGVQICWNGVHALLASTFAGVT